MRAAALQSQLPFHSGAGDKNISASLLVAGVPKILSYSTDSVCVGEGKGVSPLSCAAAPTSRQTESGDGRIEVAAITQSRCVTCFHFSDTVLVASSTAASPLVGVKLRPCSSFLSAVVNRRKRKETCYLLPDFHIRAKWGQSILSFFHLTFKSWAERRASVPFPLAAWRLRETDFF